MLLVKLDLPSCCKSALAVSGRCLQVPGQLWLFVVGVKGFSVESSRLPSEFILLFGFEPLLAEVVCCLKVARLDSEAVALPFDFAWFSPKLKGFA